MDTQFPPPQTDVAPFAVQEEIDLWKEVGSTAECSKEQCCGCDICAADRVLYQGISSFASSRLRVRLKDLDSVKSVPSVVPPFRAFRVYRGLFLKSPFLEGCQRAGLFETMAMEGAAP